MTARSDEPITLAVLAGGESSRMGSPKARLLVRGRPILEHLLDQWNWPGETMLVTAPGRENPPGWQRFDRQVADPVPAQGPLRGVVTALENCRTAGIIVVTCDMPLVTRLLLDSLAAALATRADALGVMTRRDNHEIEPFPLALRVSSLDLLRNRLTADARSMRALAALPQFALLEDRFPLQTWTNLNSPADFDAFIATA